MTPFADLQSFVVKHTAAKYFKQDLGLYKRCFPKSKLITELDRAPEFAQKGLDERMVTEILGHPDMCIDTVWEARGFALLDGKLVLLEELTESGLTEEKIKEIVEKATSLIESVGLSPVAGSSAENNKRMEEFELHFLELIEPLSEDFQNPLILDEKVLLESWKRQTEILERDEFLRIRRSDLQKIDLGTVKYNVLKSFIFDLNLNDKCKDHKTATYLQVLEAKKAEMNVVAATETTISAEDAKEDVKATEGQQPEDKALEPSAKKKEDHSENTPE
jgi:hypothetical protein